MDFSIPINWTSPFPNLGMSGAFFYFDLIFDRNFCKQTVSVDPDQTALDLGLHCLSRSKNKGRYANLGKTSPLFMWKNCIS